MRVVSVINSGADVDTVNEVCHSTPIPVHTYHNWSNIMCSGNIIEVYVLWSPFQTASLLK